MKKKQIKLTPLTPIATAVLKYGLPFVAAAFVYIAFSMSSLDAYDAVRLQITYAEELECALASLVLVVGGALIFDILEKKRR